MVGHTVEPFTNLADLLYVRCIGEADVVATEDALLDDVQQASPLARDETMIYVQKERVRSKEGKSWIERKKCLEERCDVQNRSSRERVRAFTMERGISVLVINLN